MNIRLITELIILAMMSSAFALFLKMCMRPKMIFGFYGNWLRNSIVKSKLDAEQFMKVYHRDNNPTDYKLSNSYAKLTKRKAYLYKPLGLCVYCTGTWVAITFYLIYINHGYGLMPIVNFLAYLGINFMITMVFKSFYDVMFAPEPIETNYL